MNILEQVSKATKELQDAQEALSDAIFDAWDYCATKAGLDELTIHWYGVNCTVDGQDLNEFGEEDFRYNPELLEYLEKIDTLDSLYCELIHAGGVQAHWKREKGWT